MPEPILVAIEAEGGSLSFSQFQELALYDPGFGFYATQGQAGGRRGDFITSVEVGPLFGAVIANALDTWWNELGCPDPFVVIEAAAGVGTLARTVSAAEPACRSALEHHLVEVSPGLRARHPGGAMSHPDLPDLSAHVIFANELLDNLPVDLYERINSGWAEVRVVARDGALAETLQPGSATDAERAENDLRTDSLSGPVPVGQRLPAPRRAERWLERARGLLHPGGRLVVIDYFRPITELVGLEQAHWLRTYRDHQRGSHPLDDPGRQDITCDVRLPIGPSEPEVATQAEFLRFHGIDDLVAEGRRIWAEKASRPDLEAMRARSRVSEAEALLDPDGLGGFFVCQWGP